jgi:hypothetical protein
MRNNIHVSHFHPLSMGEVVLQTVDKVNKDSDQIIINNKNNKCSMEIIMIKLRPTLATSAQYK